jgi:hypothetical protein
MERGSIHQGRGTPEERAKERTRDVSTSQGGFYLDIEKTAWSPILEESVEFFVEILTSPEVKHPQNLLCRVKFVDCSILYTGCPQME